MKVSFSWNSIYHLTIESRQTGYNYSLRNLTKSTAYFQQSLYFLLATFLYDSIICCSSLITNFYARQRHCIPIRSCPGSLEDIIPSSSWPLTRYNFFSLCLKEPYPFFISSFLVLRMLNCHPLQCYITDLHYLKASK